MKKIFSVGILAFHGDVIEHQSALRSAAEKIGCAVRVVLVRTKADAKNLDGLIIPGGESTTMQKLCEEAGIFGDIQKIKNIFGTCAGAILLAKHVGNKAAGQKTFARMDIAIDRNAYGTQSESFEQIIETKLGKMNAVFIRAPKIKSAGKNVSVLAAHDGEIIACEEKTSGGYCLAACFHPEFTTTAFHEHFLKRISAR